MHPLLEAQIRFMLWMQQSHTHALDEFFAVFTFFSGAGLLAGAGAGAALGLHQLSFTDHGVGWKRVLRFVVGMTLTGGVLYGMRKLGVPEGRIGDALPVLYLAFFGLWITFAMPWRFERTRLSD